MEHGGFQTSRFAAGIERSADRLQGFVVFPAHLFGQELQLALVRAVRRDPPGFVDVRDQALGHRQPRDLLGGRVGVLPGELKHFQSLAPLLAAARGQEFTGFKIFASHGDRIMH